MINFLDRHIRFVKMPVKVSGDPTGVQGNVLEATRTGNDRLLPSGSIGSPRCVRLRTTNSVCTCNKTLETGGERKDAQVRVYIDDLSAEP